MKRVLFIDRDNVLIKEPADEQIDSLEKLEFIPGVFTWLGKIATETDFELVMVTNQDGLGTASFPEDTFWPAHNKMLKALAGEDIHFTDIYIDRSFEHQNLPTRKPGIGMLQKYFNGNYDLAHSYVIGDRLTDVQLAKNLGAKAILFADQQTTRLQTDDTIVLITRDWNEIYKLL